MNSLPPNRAATLRDAYRICTPEPLVGEDIERYYVDLSAVRSTKTVQNITANLQLLDPGEFCTLLFTGHRGCGKSTELRRIQKKLESEYYIVYLEADLELDLNDAEYTDLYLLIIKKIADELYKIGAKFDSQLLNSFESWFKEITKETEKSVEQGISLQADIEAGFQLPFISKLLTKVLAQIKGTQKQKKIIRQTLQKDISRLQADINFLLDDAFKKLQKKVPQYSKGFLIILDNLDRIPPNVGNHLFFDYAAQLQSLHTTIIYTVPISTVYSDQNLSKSFGSPNIMPMVNLYEFEQHNYDLPYKNDRLEALASLIAQRVNIDSVFESHTQLIDLVKASGGHVRQLMQMTARACLTAFGSEHSKVTAEDVTYGINEEQFNFERINLNEYYPVLAKVCLTKNINKDEIGQLLLFNLSVLEYNGTNRWNYVNPVLKSSPLFQEALENEQQSRDN
ncbi:MAG: ATP-binding protein [Cyanobacteria bacterium P01_G01_bin.39]